MADVEYGKERYGIVRDRLIGALFLLVFALYAGGDVLIAKGQAWAGLSLRLGNSAAVIAIGLLLWPLIAEDARVTAHVYLGARVVEGLLLGGGALIWVLADSAGWNALLYHLAMIALGLGSIGFCWWLRSSRRIYGAHAWLGLIGYPCLVAAMMAGLLGLQDWENVLLLPGAVFEFTLGLYLILFGMSGVSASW